MKIRCCPLKKGKVNVLEIDYVIHILQVQAQLATLPLVWQRKRLVVPKLLAMPVLLEVL
jgi:hypothetical protein